MAKAPVPGEVKTRLTPPFTSMQAAALAQAALLDTLDAVRGSAAARRVLALAGKPGEWLGDGFDVVAQRGATFNERLANAWDDAGAPGLQIGMDTPQVSAALLDDCLARLGRGPDAVLGLATDGGWWAIGFSHPVPTAFHGVEMSRDDTGDRQLHRLRALGLRVELLPELRDVDVVTDLKVIAKDHPSLRVARAAARFGICVA